MNTETQNNSAYPILDSKHIVTTNSNSLDMVTSTLNLYNVKIIKCGDYIQIYFYKEKKSTIIPILDDLNLKKHNSNLNKEQKTDVAVINQIENDNEIKDRSIIRSKLECQRLAKANMKDWKTFITLTFEKNIVDIGYANKRLRYFIDKVKRIKKDFKYLGIPEFQKRGAVHYHLLTNISINDSNLIFSQEDNSKFKHIKYWNDGFTNVEDMKGDPKKIVGYISKYMTKEIDNRLFNRHRYFYSRNLVKAKTEYLDLEKNKDLEIFKKIIRRTDLIYQNGYVNPYDNNEVVFNEYLKIVSDEEYELREIAFIE